MKWCITQGWSKEKNSLINVFVSLSKIEILNFSLFVLLTFQFSCLTIPVLHNWQWRNNYVLALKVSPFLNHIQPGVILLGLNTEPQSQASSHKSRQYCGIQNSQALIIFHSKKMLWVKLLISSLFCLSFSLAAPAGRVQKEQMASGFIRLRRAAQIRGAGPSLG